MNFLKPVEISERYIKQIEKAISRYFYVTCFSEIFAIIDSRNFTVSNSINDLINAIQSGRIYYKDGAFRADRFSNVVSKELEKLGAIYKKGAYFIDSKQLPPSIISAIDLENVKAQNKLTSINQFLTNLEIIDITPFVKQIVEKTFEKFTRDLEQTLKDKNIPIIELPYQNPKVEIPVEETKRISDYWTEKEAEANKLRESYEQAKTELENAPDTLKRQARQKVKIAQETLRNFQKQKYKNAPKFDYTWGGGDMSAQVAENYTYNLKYWVKNWQVNNIVKMRKDVAEMVKRGARIAEVKEYFIKQWHISENKAQFLARNEIGLASTAIKKYQYTQAGCTHFKWLPSASREKRELHKKYYNKIFEFDNPPLIDEKLDIYGLPKQIWNCGCGIMPVVPKAEVKNDRSIFKRYQTRNIEYRRFTERKEV